MSRGRSSLRPDPPRHKYGPRVRSSSPCYPPREEQLLVPKYCPWSRASTPTYHYVADGGPKRPMDGRGATHWISWEKAIRQVLPWPYRNCDLQAPMVCLCHCSGIHFASRPLSKPKARPQRRSRANASACWSVTSSRHFLQSRQQASSYVPIT